MNAAARTFAVTATLAMAVAGCAPFSSTPGGGAGDALKKVYTARNTGDYTTYFDLMHPAQQAQITRAAFVSCLKNKPLTRKLVEVKILDAYDSAISIAGIPQKTAKVVTTRIDTSPLSGKSSVTHTLVTAYAVNAGGKWTWVLPATQLASLKAGNCPA
jgi:hypothetical protein